MNRFDLASELQDFERVVAPRVRLLPTSFAVSTVYHYTTAAGFCGILSQLALRATNFSFLNDPSEIKCGRDVVRKVTDERSTSGLHLLEQFMVQIRERTTAQAAAEVYVTSFSEHGDDLAQWRGYGGGQSERYSIGFNSEALDAFTSRHPHMLWDRVIYDRTEQLRRVGAIIDRAVEFVVQRSVPSSALKPFAELTALALARIMPTLKDDSYAAESEWRMIVRPLGDAKIEFEATRGIVRPFVTWKLHQPDVINDVVVLAPARRDAALKAAEMVLRSGKITNVTPTHSKVPFVD